MAGPVTGVDLRRVEALRRWARLLDAAWGIPGTPLQFGLDAVIGLVPGLGDALSGALSLVLILQAARLGVPRVVIGRMAINVLLDILVGSVPLLGDLFDVAWKANLRNVELVERFVVHGQRRATTADYFFVGAVAAVVLLALLLPLWMLLLLLQSLDRPLI